MELGSHSRSIVLSGYEPGDGNDAFVVIERQDKKD
jgi:hypothetical protein